MKFLVLDTELGGPSADEFSLLTICLKIFEGETPKAATYVDKLNLILKHDIYRISAQGMSVNQLDIAQIDKEGITVKNAKPLLYNFLNSHSNQGKDRLQLVGQGVSGDAKALTHVLISFENWEKFVNRLYVDTLSLATALRSFGGLKEDQSLNLKNLCDYAKLGPFNYHDAEGDVDATWALLVWLETQISLKGILS